MNLNSSIPTPPVNWWAICKVAAGALFALTFLSLLFKAPRLFEVMDLLDLLFILALLACVTVAFIKGRPTGAAPVPPGQPKVARKSQAKKDL